MSLSAAEINQLWHQINRAVYSGLREALQEYDLPPGAFVFFYRLAQQPGLTVSDLSRISGMAKSHVSRSMRQLARQGYIERRSDAEDQRLTRLYLTDEARAHWSAMEACTRRFWQKTIEAMPPGSWEELSAGLLLLLEVLQNKAETETGAAAPALKVEGPHTFTERMADGSS